MSKYLYKIKGKSFLYYKKSCFVVDNKKVACLNLSFIKRILKHIRATSRFFRLEPRAVGKLDDNRFLICVFHKIWILDISKNSVELLANNRDGWSDPLNFCSDGESVYWGDYGANADHEEVCIYSCDKNLKVEIVYTFPAGEIRHIHNIVFDKSNNQFYVLTGDLEKTSGIYMASADWSLVKPVVTGSQQYRAVVGFATEDGLIYATDSVESENHIYQLKGGKVSVLSSFPGSCIYGTETKNYYVFSSTVEPAEGRGLLNMFSNKLGSGIKDKYAHLITVRKSDLDVKEVLKVKKDNLPMKLFQYGAIMFPKGQENTDDLWYYVMACKGDGKSFKIKL